MGSGEPGDEPLDAASEERFRTIYRAYLADLTAYAIRRTTSSEDAADVVAEVFLVAWRRLPDVPLGDDSKLWLYGVARRVLSNRRRGEDRRTRLHSRLADELALLEAAARSTSDDVPEGFADTFAGLPAVDQEVLGLSVWEGLDAVAIGSVLGCSANAARIRMHRARRRLKKEFERRVIRNEPGPAGQESDVGTRTGEEH